MKGKVVLIQFPFDDLSSSKVRPAYCLTDALGIYQHIIFALITSRITQAPLNDNILLTPGAYVVLNPNHNSDNPTIWVGLVRTTFKF